MSDAPEKGHPIQMALIVVLLIGGGWYFFKHYNISGLDGVAIKPKADFAWEKLDDPFTFTSSTDARDSLNWPVDESGNPIEADPVIYSPSDLLRSGPSTKESLWGTPARDTQGASPAEQISAKRPPQYQNLRIASWALDGFGPTKLASNICRKNLIRVVRQFDMIALQQVSSIHQDLVPRMVDAINENSLGSGGPVFDYVLGGPTGPTHRGEQMVILFRPDRIRVDRTQTYTVADPDQQMLYDPLVAWFRAAQPSAARAWTFTVANVRIDLGRAPSEVALLGQLFDSIRDDGRGEDDILMMGLFQADDAYLLPTIAGRTVRAAVSSTPTDVFGRHQTENIVFDFQSTAEAIGRGGVYDFLRVYNLSLSEAQTVSSYLPVYAEFSPLEGSPIANQATLDQAVVQQASLPSGKTLR
ncbi:MAG: deoxyribonuclease I [Rhodopirellula sp. JB055]|uniref:deoxyribonuclease I n=1 Tax=Rhodopirellula sp. JB055 TaxID=3342846 RepID=UPI00370C3462